MVDTEHASLPAAIGAVLALPTVVALFVPVTLGLIDPWRGDVTVLALPLLLIGPAIIARTVHDFFTVGRGTLAPWDPPRRLVTTGLFARCRNPMYWGVILTVLAWAVVFGSPLVGGYAVLTVLVFHVRVIVHEEPWAAATFGDEWTAYCQATPRWVPRLR